VESYPCRRKGCSKKFRSKSDRKRHTRELHDQRSDLQSANTCPAKNCGRHRAGFSRRWNLTEHIRRRHAGEYLHYIPRDSDSLAARDVHYTTSSRLEGSAEADEDTKISMARLTDGSGAPQRLRMDVEDELSSLQVQCHEIDGRIVKLISTLEGLGQECTSSTPGYKQ
jgi:hypothetical protein